MIDTEYNVDILDKPSSLFANVVGQIYTNRHTVNQGHKFNCNLYKENHFFETQWPVHRYVKVPNKSFSAFYWLMSKVVFKWWRSTMTSIKSRSKKHLHASTLSVTDKDSPLSRVCWHLELVPAWSSAQVVCWDILCPLVWVCKTAKCLDLVQKWRWMEEYSRRYFPRVGGVLHSMMTNEQWGPVNDRRRDGVEKRYKGWDVGVWKPHFFPFDHDELSTTWWPLV